MSTAPSLYQHAQPASVFQADLAWEILGRLVHAYPIWDQGTWRDPRSSFYLTDRETNVIERDAAPATRCGSALCYAGMVVDLTGGRWAVPQPLFEKTDKVSEAVVDALDSYWDEVVVPSQWDCHPSCPTDVAVEDGVSMLRLNHEEELASKAEAKIAGLFAFPAGQRFHIAGAREYANTVLGADLEDVYAPNNDLSMIVEKLADVEAHTTGEPYWRVVRMRGLTVIKHLNQVRDQYQTWRDAAVLDSDERRHYARIAQLLDGEVVSVTEVVDHYTLGAVVNRDEDPMPRD